MPEKTSLISNLQNTFLTIALVIASGLVGHLWTKSQYLEGNLDKTPTNNAAAAQNAGVPQVAGAAVNLDPEALKVTSDDLIRGNKDADIVLIEYSDLECPFCSRFHTTAQQFLNENKNDIAWVYRHFPLRQIHPKAQKFAEGVECVRQSSGNDKAWELVDKIFSDQTVSLDALPQLVASLGVNSNNFSSCLANANSADLVEKQFNQGADAGVTGTPGNILINFANGKSKLVPGAVSIEALKSALNEIK